MTASSVVVVEPKSGVTASDVITREEELKDNNGDTTKGAEGLASAVEAIIDSTITTSSVPEPSKPPLAPVSEPCSPSTSPTPSSPMTTVEESMIPELPMGQHDNQKGTKAADPQHTLIQDSDHQNTTKDVEMAPAIEPERTVPTTAHPGQTDVKTKPEQSTQSQSPANPSAAHKNQVQHEPIHPSEEPEQTSAAISNTQEAQHELFHPSMDPEEEEPTSTIQDQQAAEAIVANIVESLEFNVLPIQREIVQLVEPTTTKSTAHHVQQATVPPVVSDQVLETLDTNPQAMQTEQQPEPATVSVPPTSSSSSSSSSSKDTPVGTNQTIVMEQGGESSTAATSSAVVPPMTEIHSLTSYIKRSLSGIFSDIAEATAHQDPSSDVQEQQHEYTIAIRDNDSAATSTDAVAPPVRKRSRVDLAEAYEATYPPSAPETNDTLVTSQQHHNDPVHDDSRHNGHQQHPSTPTRLSRRRSFSYQCLNKLFQIEDDAQPSAGAANTNSTAEYPTTTTPNPLTSAGSVLEQPPPIMTPELTTNCGQSDTPFKMPQPPLEESESMSSFIQVLSAVDLDSMGNNEDDDDKMQSSAPNDRQQPEDTFGWYVSDDPEATEQHMVKEPPVTFLPPADSFEEGPDLMDMDYNPTPSAVVELVGVKEPHVPEAAATPPSDGDPLAPSVVEQEETDSAAAISNKTQAKVEAHAVVQNGASTIADAAANNAAAAMVDDLLPQHQQQERTSDEMEVAEAELEYAIAADTVDNVLGDFFG
ncbi:expressed unknown protein [Seminavis robusta]|uniref:Uncharacterized protein n=1 Tax=Seminavis robusta TaxID=568900 RepID=A0A9N8DR11_9STRA|nr:expressed unknown protein [Seminavis robusta]|eukprot:Sro220_g090660.1 n/a (758) ;mRNA; f:14536-16809